MDYRSPEKKIKRTLEIACDQCQLFGVLGVLKPLEASDRQAFEHLLQRKLPLVKSQVLFHAGQPFNGIYAVQSGSFKSISQQGGNEEQVVGFHLPGELLALDAVSSSHYSRTVMALETSTVCLLQLEDMKKLGKKYPAFQEQLIQAMSTHIQQEQQQAALAAKQSAEGRLAAFLLSLSKRQAHDGAPVTELHMSMSRPDIASYLGLAMATVSRIIQCFQAQELLTVSGKWVTLIDIDGLEQLTAAARSDT